MCIFINIKSCQTAQYSCSVYLNHAKAKTSYVIRIHRILSTTLGRQGMREISRSITTSGPASWKSDIELNLEGIAAQEVMLDIYSVNIFEMKEIGKEGRSVNEECYLS